MKRFLQLTLVILSLLLVAGVVAAAPPIQEDGEGQTYIVKRGDGLIQLAREFYGDGDAYVLIVEATNALAATDSSFREITDPNIILVGEKLWIPGVTALPADEAAAEETAPAEEAAPADETAAGDESAATEDAAAAEEGEMAEETVGAVPLAGTSWLLSSLNSASPLPKTTITLEFVDETAAGGTSGCNNYSTTYELDGIRISFGQTAGTRKACLEPVMAQEQSYLAALSDAAFYEVTEQGLSLFDSKTTQLAHFEPASSDLAGSDWDVISYNNGKGGVVSVISGTSISASFGEDGQVSGSAGCNDYFGPYTTEGSAISIGPLAATRKLCVDEDVMTQEGAYLSALETAATYKITGDRMEMRREDGALVANFSRSQAADQ